MTSGTILRSRCTACGAELTRHERYAGGVCGDMSCRRRRVDARNAAEMAELRQLRDARAASAGLPATQRPPVVVVSWYETAMVPVPAAQRQALREHLLALRSEVEALQGMPQPAAAPAPAAPAVDSLLAKVCASCTGHCCRDGNGRMAFLDARAMQRAVLDAPDSTYAEVVDAYLADIPQRHHADSCVFHGERGCALPRHRRADLCNRWECPGLREARNHAESSGATQFFVVRGRIRQAFAADFVPPCGDREKTGV